MKLNPVDVVCNISGEDFRRTYLTPKRPVILKGIAEHWKAFEKWKLPYFKQLAGHIEVPLYNNSKPTPETKLNAPDLVLKFGEYLDRIAAGPVELRMFLFNIFEHIPDLCNDFYYPEHLMKGFLKKYPMMFYGGAGSIVYLHYDMDMSNVFLTQFHGKKRVILFEQQYSRHLYRLPFTVQSYVDVENPDFEAYPAMRHLEGYEVVMEHGDMLYIPAGMWHYMNYLEGGYALALRAWDPSYVTRAKGIANLTLMRTFDDAMKKQLGARWFAYKTEKARQLADGLVQKMHYPPQLVES
jgi:ribosomal protein L16 Arg81 hydroxylase